jgi:hypothetical protein
MALGNGEKRRQDEPPIMGKEERRKGQKRFIEWILQVSPLVIPRVGQVGIDRGRSRVRNKGVDTKERGFYRFGRNEG